MGIKKLLSLSIVAMLFSAVFAASIEPTNFDMLRVTSAWGISGYSVVSPSSVTTINVVPTCSVYVIENGATIPTLGITLSTSVNGIDAFDGQIYRIFSVPAVTALTVASTSSIGGPTLTALTAGQHIAFFYRKALNKFVRCE